MTDQGGGVLWVVEYRNAAAKGPWSKCGYAGVKHSTAERTLQRLVSNAWPFEYRIAKYVRIEP